MRLLTLRTVLATTDLTPTSDAALDSAARLAAASGATFHVAHSVPERHDIIAQTGRRTEYVHAVGDALRRAHVKEDERQVHIVTGDAPTAISALSDRIGANVIVLGRHREATQLRPGQPVGSTAYNVITRSGTPCLVIGHPLALPLMRVLVAFDGSQAASGALLVALAWSSALRSRALNAGESTLTALHVDSRPRTAGDDPAERATMDHQLDALRRSAGCWAGVTVHSVTQASDDVVEAIASYAIRHDADLIVLGTRGLRADSSPELGSISAAIVRKLEIPVLLVPPAIWRDYAKDFDSV